MVGSPIAAGALVRLKNDPGRNGTTTGKSRPRGDHVVYQVRFPEGPSFVPDYELELMSDDTEDVYSLLEQGRFGGISDLRRNLTHIQLTGRLANLVYSMDTTNTDFYAHQFKPVLSFLESPSKGLLIADEVGLGKTIEAGLIWTELRARYDARRLLVVCPAMLRNKWKDELAHRFSVQAEIVDAAGLLEALQKNKNSVSDGRALICSLQGVRPPQGWDDEEKNGSSAARLARYLDAEKDNEPLIDLVIVDESHYLRNPETQNARFGRLIRDVTEHIVLLSATPINLSEDDLFHQLNLVDQDFFADRDSFPEVMRANEPLVRAREFVLNREGTVEEIVDCLVEAKRHRLLARNGQLANLLDDAIDVSALASEESRIRLANRIERINLLSHTVSRTRKADVQELRVVRKASSYYVPMSEMEREIYDRVTDAILDYAEYADISSGFLLAGPQRQVSSSLYAALRSWTAKQAPAGDQFYEDFGIELDNPSAEPDKPIRDRLIRDVLPGVDLERLRASDTKFAELRRVLQMHWQQHPAQKVVIFSYYPGSLEYLRERLAEEGIESRVLHGSVKQSKQELIEQFRDNPRCLALLSSEVASEGVDLQFCSVLVNYDLPWNPMKVEQRIGRIDRLGQQAERINIINLGHAGTIDDRIRSRLMDRLNIFERALGGMEAILGEEIQALTSDLLSQRLTPDQQEQRIRQSALAVEQIRQQQEDLENQASHMIAHGGYILEQVQAAHQFKKRITSEDLMIYVKDYLNRHCAGFEFRQIAGEELLFEVRLPPDICALLDDYNRKLRLVGQSRLATGERIRCRFKNKLHSPTRHEEWISQFHPLIRFISEDLRIRDEAYFPLIAVTVDGQSVGLPVRDGLFAFVVRRWAFSGLKQEEQLSCRVFRLSDQTLLEPDQSLELVNQIRLAGRDWMQAKGLIQPASIQQAFEQCDSTLDLDYQEAADDRTLENRDRVNFQLVAAERERDRELRVRQDILNKFIAEGKTQLVPATRGRIKKVEERFALKESQLGQRLELRRSSFDVCSGVLHVT